jgi:hypothetical protein
LLARSCAKFFPRVPPITSEDKLAVLLRTHTMNHPPSAPPRNNDDDDEDDDEQEDDQHSIGEERQAAAAAAAAAAARAEVEAMDGVARTRDATTVRAHAAIMGTNVHALDGGVGGGAGAAAGIVPNDDVQGFAVTDESGQLVQQRFVAFLSTL